MNVLVDTPVWSESLRKRKGNLVVIRALEQLLLIDRVEMIGPIRQEILSGISDPFLFVKVKKRLEDIDDFKLDTEHFVTAADFSNQCRRKGTQGSPVDFLICAVSKMHRIAIFTTDGDFPKYDQILGLDLYKV